MALSILVSLWLKNSQSEKVLISKVEDDWEEENEPDHQKELLTIKKIAVNYQRTVEQWVFPPLWNSENDIIQSEK